MADNELWEATFTNNFGLGGGAMLNVVVTLLILSQDRLRQAAFVRLGLSDPPPLYNDYELVGCRQIGESKPPLHRSTLPSQRPLFHESSRTHAASTHTIWK